MTNSSTRTRGRGSAEGHRVREAGGAVLAQAVRDRITLAGVLALLMVGMGLMVGGLWPTMKDSLAEMAEALPEAFATMLAGADMATPVGWTNAEMNSLMVPAATIAAGVISASRAIAGEEEDGTLGALLGAPVTRTTFLLAKAGAMAVHVLVVCVGVAAGLALGSAVGGLGLTFGGIVGLSVHAGLLGLVFGALALVIAARTGSRRRSSAGAGGMAVVSFAAAGFLPLSTTLAEGARLSPWFYYNSTDPLGNGLDPVHAALLAALAALAVALAVVLFKQRDLRG